MSSLPTNSLLDSTSAPSTTSRNKQSTHGPRRMIHVKNSPRGIIRNSLFIRVLQFSRFSSIFVCVFHNFYYLENTQSTHNPRRMIYIETNPSKYLHSELAVHSGPSILTLLINFRFFCLSAHYHLILRFVRSF